MATNILNYAPEATPPSMVGPSTTQSPVSHAPHATPPSAPTASGDQDLWAGRLRPAEIQIIVIGTP